MTAEFTCLICFIFSKILGNRIVQQKTFARIDSTLCYLL